LYCRPGLAGAAVQLPHQLWRYMVAEFSPMTGKPSCRYHAEIIYSSPSSSWGWSFDNYSLEESTDVRFTRVSEVSCLRSVVIGRAAGLPCLRRYRLLARTAGGRGVCTQLFAQWAKDQTISEKAGELIAADFRQQHDVLVGMAKQGRPVPADSKLMPPDRCWSCQTGLDASHEHCDKCGAPVGCRRCEAYAIGSTQAIRSRHNAMPAGCRCLRPTPA